jgi:mannosyltransferase
VRADAWLGYRRPISSDASPILVRRSAVQRPWTVTPTAAAVLGLTALGGLLRLWGLGHQGLWYDESDTALLMRYSAGHMLGLLPHLESTPPLYYCVAWVWVRVFGQDAAGLRSLSAVAGIAVIPVAYATTAELTSRRAGLICTALTACNPLLVWYSQEARAYELLVLLSALSLLAAARAARAATPGRLAAWALAAGLALATHYYAVLLVAGEVVWLLWRHRGARAVLAATLAILVVGGALLPLAIAQDRTGNNGWIAHGALGLRLAQLLPQFVLGTGAPARVVLKFTGLALGLGGLVGLARAPAGARRGGGLAAGLALGGFALSLGLVAAGSDDLITRNLLALWLPLAIAVAAGLAAVPRLGPAAAAGLCAIGVIAIVGVATDARRQRPDWPGVARVLGDEPAGGARAILIQRYRTLLPLSLDLPGLHELHAPARVRGLDVIAMHSPGQPLCWWGAECNLYSSPTQARYPIPGLRIAARHRVGQFEITELRGARPIRLTRSAVARALTATDLDHDELMVQARR